MISSDEVFLRGLRFFSGVFLCDSAVTRMIEEGAVKTVRGREEQKREGGPPLRSLGYSHVMSESGLEGGSPISRE